jgi:hypothetical protein
MYHNVTLKHVFNKVIMEASIPSDRSIAGIAGSNPIRGVDVCLLYFSVLCRLRPLWLAHHASRKS